LLEERKKGRKEERKENLDNGSDELLEEVGDFEERRPELLDKVEEETFDVRSIEILIRHEHEMTITEVLDAFLIILHAMLETKDLGDGLDLLVAGDLLRGSISDVEKFSSQGKHAVSITTNDTET
jgi:hypothetical protein